MGSRHLGGLLGQRASCALPLRGARNRCATVSPPAPLSPGGSRSCATASFPHCLAARLVRCWRSGNRRADMRPETRDLAGGHETLRPPVEGYANGPPVRPQPFRRVRPVRAPTARKSFAQGKALPKTLRLSKRPCKRPSPPAHPSKNFFVTCGTKRKFAEVNASLVLNFGD